MKTKNKRKTIMGVFSESHDSTENDYLLINWV
jgi:hypothetical protein